MINENKEINNEIKFLAKSGIRLKILKELKQKPHTIRELVRSTKITYSSISSNVHKLQKSEYITKIDKQYHITPLSEVYFDNLMEFKQSIDFITDFKEFWFKHDINPISEDSMRNITSLSRAKLIETNPTDIYKTQNIITTDLEKTKNLKAIFPYIHPNYPKLIKNILIQNGKIELIIPQNLFKGLMYSINTDLKKTAFKNGNLKVYFLEDEMKLHLSICDKKMHLGLFKNDGSYDQNRLLTSNDKKSMKWAEDLFENILNKVKE